MLSEVIESSVSSSFSLNVPDIIQICMVGVTFLAVFVALFQEVIKRFFTRACLKISINLEPPDCHQIALTDQTNGNFITKCIYLRTRIDNISKNTAKNIEVVAANLWRIENNTKTKVKTFLPMNLRWSHSHPIKITIPPGSFRFCDIGPVRPLKDVVILRFDLEIQPNPVSGGVYPNIIGSGTYNIELLVTGDNVDPHTSRWELVIPNIWKDSEDEMLSLIKIREL